MPGEGFVLLAPNSEPVEQGCADDQTVNHLAEILEAITTDSYDCFDYDGSPAELATRLLDLVFVANEERAAKLMALTAILARC